MTNYFMSTDDRALLALECGQTVEVIENLSAGKIEDLRAGQKDTPELLARAVLEFVLQSWSFTDKAGVPMPLTIDNVYGLKFKVFEDLLKKVMDHYEIPFDKTTSSTEPS